MRKTIPTLGIVSAGLLLAGSPAHAVETDMSSNLNVGIANGIQALLPIQAPVNLCGNAIGLLGSANSYCVGGAQADYASPVNNPVYNPYLFAQGGYGQNLPIPVFPTYPVGGGGPDSDLQSALNAGIANGIQADAKVQAPINLCGNAIGLLGSANAYCADGAAANLFANRGVAQTVPIILPARNTTARPAHTNARPTAGKPAVKPTGAKPGPRPTAAKPPIKPTAAKQTGVKSTPNKRGVAAKPGKKTEGGLLANLLAPVTGLLTGGGAGGFGGERCGDVDMSTFGNVGAANGIQAHAPIQVPINLTGNAIGLLGSATGLSTAGANANYCS